MAKNPDWTEAENSIVRELAGKVTNDVIAERVGRTRAAVTVRIAILGLRSLHARWERVWEAPELGELRRLMAEGMNAPQIGRRIGRTPAAVFKAAYKLGLDFGCMPRWTAEEDAFVRQNAGKMTARQIGDAIGRSQVAVRSRAGSFGISTLLDIRRAQAWTPEEVEILRANHDKGLTAIELGKLCNKSKTSVYHKLERMGLSLKSEFWWTPEQESFLRESGSQFTPSELEARFGRSRKTIRAKARSMGIKLRRNVSPAVALAKVERERQKAAAAPVLTNVKYMCVEHQRERRPARPAKKAAKIHEVKSVIAYCPRCSAPVLNTWDGWQGHKERTSCIGYMQAGRLA